MIISIFIMGLSVNRLTGQTDTTSLSRALLIAVYNNSTDSTLMLLRMGAKINYSDGNGQTPLFYAIQNQNLDMVKLLEYNGADLNKRNFDGTTPLSAATWFGFFDIAEYLCYKGAMVNRSDVYGAIPLHYAAYLGSYYMADMLIFYKSDVNSKSFDKNTPLHLAAFTGDTALMNLLLSHGAKPYIENSNGRTPIEMAIEHKQLDATLLLLRTDSLSDYIQANGNMLINLAIKVGADTIADSLIACHRITPTQENDDSNPLNVALLTGNYSLKPALKRKGYSSGLWPYFARISVMNSYTFNKDDHYLGFQLGLMDIKYNLEFSLGYGSRFSRKPVLITIDKNTFYQLNEQRNYIDFGVKKRFYVSRSTRNFNVFAGVDFQFHFGNYSGTTTKLQQQFAAIPKVGFAVNFKPFFVEVSYNYMDYGLYDFSPHFFSAGIGFDFSFISQQTVYTPSWL